MVFIRLLFVIPDLEKINECRAYCHQLRDKYLQKKSSTTLLPPLYFFRGIHDYHFLPTFVGIGVKIMDICKYVEPKYWNKLVLPSCVPTCVLKVFLFYSFPAYLIKYNSLFRCIEIVWYKKRVDSRVCTRAYASRLMNISYTSHSSHFAIQTFYARERRKAN